MSSGRQTFKGELMKKVHMPEWRMQRIREVLTLVSAMNWFNNKGQLDMVSFVSGRLREAIYSTK
jgi:hypothetical protein